MWPPSGACRRESGQVRHECDGFAGDLAADDLRRGQNRVERNVRARCGRPPGLAGVNPARSGTNAMDSPVIWPRMTSDADRTASNETFRRDVAALRGMRA